MKPSNSEPPILPFSHEAARLLLRQEEQRREEAQQDGHRRQRQPIRWLDHEDDHHLPSSPASTPRTSQDLASRRQRLAEIIQEALDLCQDIDFEGLEDQHEGQ